MLTPQEVSERVFTKASFGGYNMAQVDEFLDVLTVDYGALYNENAVLKSKMKVLVEKVEEYRSTEEAMRKALMTAQRMADDLVREAESKRADMLKEAEAAAKETLLSLQSEIDAEQFRLAEAKKVTAAFVKEVHDNMACQAEYLNALADIAPAQSVGAKHNTDVTVSEIDDSVQRLVGEAILGATVENLSAELHDEPEDNSDTAEFAPIGAADLEKAASESEETQKRVDFGDLQFGKDYQID